MRQQVEARLVVLREILVKRKAAVVDRQAQVEKAVAERDFIVGGIAELEYAIKQEVGDEPEDDGKVKGRIPAKS